MKRCVIFCALAVLGVASVLYCIFHYKSKSNHSQPTMAHVEANVDIENSLIPYSPMAKVLADSNAPPLEALQAISEIFKYYTLEPGNALPVGTNQEITEALTRQVPFSIPYIPEGHPSINESGELVDHWRTPYFFHALSSQEMEVRSAGGDRVMYTADDLVWPEVENQQGVTPVFERSVKIR